VLQEGEVRRVGEAADRKVDVRVIAATNRDLRAEVKAGRFREDLFFRLHVFPIEVPPLRDRLEDVPPLTVYFLKKHAPDQRVRFAPEAMDLLCRYAWPGNVRELENEVQRALLLAGEVERIGPEALSEGVRGKARRGEGRGEGTLNAAVEQVEREVIVEALRRCKGNRTHAARALGVSRWGLVQKIERYRIED
jgi:Nif-specific regulatory protein